jgi:hypothetical protein
MPALGFMKKLICYFYLRNHLICIITGHDLQGPVDVDPTNDANTAAESVL